MSSIPSPLKPSSPPGPFKDEPEDEEEDYMSMTIAEPPPSTIKETYTQRRTRLARAAEAASRRPAPSPLPNSDALATFLPSTSKGFQMLSKLGYEPGSTLGAKDNPNARLEPLGVVVKEDRGGIGLDSEKKRKFREKVEGEREQERMSEEGYREWFARAMEEKRVQGLAGGAMVVLERFEGEEEEGEPEGEGKDGLSVLKGNRKKPTRQINVLWRYLPRQREKLERERRMQYDMLQRLSQNTNYNDPEEEDIEEDPELEAFLALEPAERLRRVVEYLREKHHYCFWCKFGYPDESMEGCPGVREDDHY
ncbi:hypothetical protein MMC30_000268 [Trapelia coarctata]|nr:hypothetical protein [Trapelia coarctata]